MQTAVRTAMAARTTFAASARRLCAAAATPAPVEAPTWHQLFLHGRLAAVPFVGFGFMDHIIMIQAGDAIDATFGVTLGLSTLTAAALGNVCSDSSGVLFGNFIERASERLNLAQAKMTVAQLKLPSTKRAAMVGQFVGVVCGCCLGMTNLFFMDLEATERLKMAKKLDTIFEPVIRNCKSMTDAERFSLYLYDEDKRELWTRVSVDDENIPSPSRIIRLSLDAPSLAATSAKSQTLINIADVKADPRHDGSWDKKTGQVTRNLLCMPILDDDGKLYGCLQAVNKRAAGGFTTDDEKLLTMVSSHISMFVHAVMDGD